MGISPELEKRIRKHDENRNFKNSKPDWIDKSAEQQKKFVSSYPKDLIRKIKIDNYVSGKKLKNGKPDKNTFTYLLEFESTDFGTIGGTPMSKYVVGVNLKTQEYTLGNLEKGFKSHSEAFKKTINLIADCVDAAGEFDKDKDWKKLSDTIAEKIESQKYTPSIVVITKIIAMYYPKNFPYIWSHPYLNKTLNLFGIDYSDLPKKAKKGKFYEKMKRLVDAKNSHPIMNEWNNEFFRELITEMVTGKSSQSAQKDSRLLKFLKYELRQNMKANYQPIVIKTLLEAGEGFRVSVKEIREKFDKLNFDRETYQISRRPGGNDAIHSVVGALKEFVSFTGETDDDTATLRPETFSSRDIPECLKICGREIVRWHINKIAKNEKLGIWRVLPGTTESNFQYEKEFRESNTIGVGYWMDNLDLTDFTIDEVKKKCDNIFTMKYPQEKRATPAMKASVTAITHKITPKDIVVLTRGEKEVIDFGIVTSKYFFNEKSGTGYHQRRKVVWLNQGPISKAVLPFISKGPSSAVWDFSDENKEKVIEFLLGEKSESHNYYVITQNPDSKYNDIVGKQYEFPLHISNAKKFAAGTNFIIQSTIDGTHNFVGYGTVREVKSKTSSTNGKQTIMCTATYSKYTKFDEPKLRTEEINSKMLWIAFPNTGSNPQPPAMLQIPRSLYAEIIGEVLIDDDQLSDTLNLDPYIEALDWIPNLILYGPPGTGKTYHAKEIAKKITDKKIYNVTFHPSYSYEDFIEGYRPKIESYTEISEDENSIKDGKYKKLGDYLRNSGKQEITLTFSQIEQIIDSELPPSTRNYKAWWGNEAPKGGGQPQRAVWISAGYKVKRGSVSTIPSDDNKVIFEKIGIQNSSSSPYVLETGIFKQACEDAKNTDKIIVIIIDEINRGNIPKIFGELISLIEKDKRGPDNTLTLAYSKDDFFVPKNIRIIGTMNTADKSLVQMDEALRRRFAFEELMPEPNLLDKRPSAKYKDILEKLNKKIVATDEKKRQYRDKQIGHSYFWNIENDNHLRLVIKYQIIPLLQDYFYDDYAEIKGILGDEIITKENRQSDLLDKGNEAKLKDALLKALNPSKNTEQKKSTKDTEKEEDDNDE